MGSPIQEVEAPSSESSSLVSKCRAVLTTKHKFRALLHPIWFGFFENMSHLEWEPPASVLKDEDRSL